VDAFGSAMAFDLKNPAACAEVYDAFGVFGTIS
jgi:hypothetical protein